MRIAMMGTNGTNKMPRAKGWAGKKGRKIKWSEKKLFHVF